MQVSSPLEKKELLNQKLKKHKKDIIKPQIKSNFKSIFIIFESFSQQNLAAIMINHKRIKKRIFISKNFQKNIITKLKTIKINPVIKLLFINFGEDHLI
jgi:hypothetical protein